MIKELLERWRGPVNPATRNRGGAELTTAPTAALPKGMIQVGARIFSTTENTGDPWPSSWLQEEEELGHLKAYEVVSSVYRGVSLIASNLAGCPLKFWKGEGAKRRELKDGEHWLVDAFRAGNDVESEFAIKEAWQTYADLTGTGYLYLERFGNAFDPEIQVLPAHLVRAKYDRKGELVGYELRVGAGAPVKLDPDDVQPMRYFNPFGAKFGLSPLAAATLAYKIQRLAQRWAHQLYQRGGEASGLFIAENGWSPDKIRRFELIQKKRWSGPDQAGRTLVLPPGVKRERTMLTPKELSFIEQYKLTKSDVYETLGIPPWMVGIKDGNGMGGDGTGAKTDERLYWRNTVMPRGTRQAVALNHWWLKLYAPGITAEYDFSGVTALKLEEIEVAAQATTVTGRPAMTTNEFRTKFQGLEPMKGEEFDTIMVPLPPVAPGDNAPDAKSEASKSADPEEQRAAERAELRASLIRKMSRHERRLERAYRQLFAAQQGRVLALARAEHDPVRLNLSPELLNTVRMEEAARNRVEDFAETPEDRALIEAAVRRVIELAGEQALADLALSADYDLTRASVVRFIAQHLDRALTDVTATTRALVRSEMADAIAAGGGLDLVVQAIDRAFDRRRDNVLTIARTESAAAFNFANVDAWEQSDGVVEGLEWVAIMDDHTREAHREADGQRIPMGEAFLVDGESLRFPGDPAGSAQNVIACRCAVQPVLAEEVRRRGRTAVFGSTVYKRARAGDNVKPHVNGNGKPSGRLKEFLTDALR